MLKGITISRAGIRPRFAGRYDWTSHAAAVSNVRSAVAENKPKLFALIEKFEAGAIRDPLRIRNGIYSIDSRVMKKWGLGHIFTRGFKYFDRSFINALTESFPKLGLNRFGFMIMWDKLSKEEASEAVRFRLGPQDLGQIYSLTNKDLISCGLGNLVNGRGVKHFNSRLLREILPQVFPELSLNPALFKYQMYKNVFEVEQMVRGRIFERYPELKRLYLDTQRMYAIGSKVAPGQIGAMRKIVTGITQKEFLKLGLYNLVSGASYRQRFQCSYRKILVRSFTLLELKESDFYRTPRWRTREEAKQNIREAFFKHFVGLKKKYQAIQQGAGNGGTLKYRFAAVVLSVSRKKLKRWGLNIDGQGAKKYFNNSFIQAVDESFSAVGFKEIREEFNKNHYDLAAVSRIVDYIDLFEKVSSGDFALSAEDKEFIRYLASPACKAEIAGIGCKVPKLLLIHLAAIRSIRAPRLLKMLSL